VETDKANISSSGDPGLVSAIQRTSTPTCRSASTAGRGKFSSARKFMLVPAGKPFAVQDLARIRETGANIGGLERRIAGEDLIFGPACRQEIDDQFHREPRAFNNRFPNKNLRVHGDVVTPVHAVTISEQSGGK
jgi:hypothetical protein